MTLRCVSLWQPWASGVAEGLKHWETRSWSTDYRGELAIASTSGRPKEAGEHLRELLPHRACPQGGILAVADLIEVFPIVAPVEEQPLEPGVDCVALDEDGDLRVWRWSDPLGIGHPYMVVGTSPILHGHDELPWGDYTPGRFVWVLDRVRRLPHPVPVLGKQRIYYLDETAERLVRSQL